MISTELLAVILYMDFPFAKKKCVTGPTNQKLTLIIDFSHA